MPTFNFVPRADNEGAVGLQTRRWTLGAFVTVLCSQLTDGDESVNFTDLVAVVAALAVLAAIDGLIFCDGDGNFSAPANLDWKAAAKRLSVGKDDPQYTLEVSGNEAHPAAVVKQNNALGKGQRIIPGADSLAVLELLNAAGSIVRHEFFGSGDVHLAVGNGKVGIGTATPASALDVKGLPVYADNAAALAGGLVSGSFYRLGGDPDYVCVVH